MSNHLTARQQARGRVPRGVKSKAKIVTSFRLPREMLDHADKQAARHNDGNRSAFVEGLIGADIKRRQEKAATR